MKTAVFCDFDGTVALSDVGYRMFHHFSGGRNDQLIPDWKSGKLSSRDCLLREAAMIDASENEIVEFISRFELDIGFADFAHKCRENEFDLTIVSDGLDLYIRPLLKQNNLDHIKLFANHGWVVDGRLNIEFPFNNGNCKRCGNCKAERIAQYRKGQTEEMRILFVGDGYSDICATGVADIIFAKKDLKQYCLENSVDCLEYNSFIDVDRQLIDKGVWTKRPLG